jgi:hypothetical protein
MGDGIQDPIRSRWMLKSPIVVIDDDDQIDREMN